jgi:hypothetical protein
MARKDKGQGRNQLTFSFEVTTEEMFELKGGSNSALSDFDFRLRQALKEGLERAGKRQQNPLSRAEIADRMSALLGRVIKKSHLDEWTAMATISRKIHADALKALCEVTGDLGPVHVFVESFGLRALDAEMAKCAEYGAAEIVRRSLASKQKNLTNDLEGISQTLAERLLAGGKA